MRGPTANNSTVKIQRPRLWQMGWVDGEWAVAVPLTFIHYRNVGGSEENVLFLIPSHSRPLGSTHFSGGGGAHQREPCQYAAGTNRLLRSVTVDDGNQVSMATVRLPLVWCCCGDHIGLHTYSIVGRVNSFWRKQLNLAWSLKSIEKQKRDWVDRRSIIELRYFNGII